MANCRSPKSIKDPSLAALVRQYQIQCRPRTVAEIRFFQSQPDLEAAVGAAASATNANGKRFSHQRRIGLASLRMATEALHAALPVLAECRSFEEVFRIVERSVSEIHGIGGLYVYDTAQRIGASLGLLPDRVYLHSGTRKGAMALGFDGTRQSITVAELPTELRTLPPHEAEDFLCIFKDQLHRHFFRRPKMLR